MEETNRHTKTKRFLFFGIVGLIFLPMIQHATQFLKLKPLNGSFEIVKKPTFTVENWLEGTFQDETQDYLKENVGFRSFFVRLYNQQYFTFFNTPRASQVIIGKENYLYEENYIKAYLGSDFIGEDKIQEKIKKLKQISDTLHQKGITILVVLAPGKASYYPEFIPDSYQAQKRSITNYEVYAREMLKAQIHLLDFHRWFGSMKSSSPYPLFPKTGIHWSKYGELLACDSIIKYINSIPNNQVPRLKFGKIELSTTMRDTDDDIEKGMNLLFNISDFSMAYPQVEIQKIAPEKNSKVLTIADSYYWGIYNWGCSRDIFNNGQFWYYNTQIYPDSFEKPLLVEQIDIKKEVEKNKVIILLSTDANLPKFAFGFIDQLHAAYVGEDKHSNGQKVKLESRIQEYILKIKQNAEWLTLVNEQAKKEKITLQDALRKNAEYMIWLEEKK